MMLAAFIMTVSLLLGLVVGLAHLGCFLFLVALRWHSAVACWAERRRDFPRAVARDRWKL